MSRLTATPAAWPATLSTAKSIDVALTCTRNTGALQGKVFAVGPWVDSTGKSNSVAQGATGAFLPQAGTATFLTDTIRRAGGEALVNYFGAAPVAVTAHYSINGVFNSLDFGTPVAADVRVAGIGPIMQSGFAQLTMSIQLDAASTRLNRQMSMMTRTVRYSQVGVSTGRSWGDILATGAVTFQDQQRLQLEAINGPIAIGVLDVIMKEFPATAKCREYLPEAPSEPEQAAEERPVRTAFSK